MNDADRALVDRFLDMMVAEAGAARNTLLAYRRDLEAGVEVLGEVGTADSAALKRLGEAWRDLAPSTVSRRASSLRRFYGFLFDEGFRPDDPSAALPRPVHQRPLPRILDAPEIEAMFRDAEERAASGQREAVRNLSLLELLYGSGLRATELVSLPRGALRVGQPYLILRGKGPRSGSSRAWGRSGD